MSTQNPQTQALAPNTPELLTCLDTAEVDPETDPDPDFDLDTRPRRPPEPDDPPRGTTRNLGGACPDCGAPMITRLRAQYGNRDAAKVKLQGYCSDDDCGLMVEGFSETFGLVQKEV